MKKVIDYLKKVKNIYLYLIIISLLIVCIIVTILFVTKKQVVNNCPVLESNAFEEEKVEEVKTIKVDVKGNVVNPGVYELNVESRVIDAINMAGGLLENSDTSLINLSKILTDEMTIIIYSKEQIETYKTTKKEIEYVYIEIEKCPDKVNDACINQNNNEQSSSEVKEDSKNTDESKEEMKDNKLENETTDDKIDNELLSINKATVKELTTLSGIGESKAKAIIEYREKNGNFKTIDEIKNVSGIGNSLFEKIKDNITI